VGVFDAGDPRFPLFFFCAVLLAWIFRIRSDDDRRD
jgi:hypothetical protein